MTAETWIAKALAKELGLPFVYLRPSDFLRGIVGETEGRVKQVISIIEALAPVIVFIDECDQLLVSRASVMSTDSGVSSRMTSGLLEWLGGEERKAFVIGATNWVEKIDSAFLRPGRMDKTALILTPDLAARKGIMRVHLEVLKHRPVKDVDYDLLASKTEWWSGAELEALVNEASWIAVEKDVPITTDVLTASMQNISPDIGERKKKVQTYIGTYKTLENQDPYFLQQIKAAYEQDQSGQTDSVSAMFATFAARQATPGA